MSGCYKRVNFYDLCRLCAQNIQKNKIKIFEEGPKSDLHAKIKKCLAINVKEDDFLPKVICTKCIKLLEICNAFREGCVNSETMLSSYFKNYRHTEDFKKSGKVYIKDTVKSDIIDPNQSLNKNPSTTPSKITVFQSKILPPAAPITKAKPINNSPKPVVSNKKIKMQDTALMQTMQLDFINEALKKAVQQLPKEILNKVIVNSNGEVINLSPPDSLSIEAPQLPQTVIKNKLKKKPVVNNIIEIDLTKEDNNGTEKEVNKSNNAPVQNPTVIFPVPQYQNNIYPNVPTSVINVICSNPIEENAAVASISQPSSINMEDLRGGTQPFVPKPKHTKPKVEEPSAKMHTCEVCSKTFKRREHLYQHVKLHTGFRPYQCTDCKKTFVRKEHLLRHMVLHSGERNFSCDICSKSFSRHDNLLKHIRTHNKESSYTCEICQKIFLVKHYYDLHRGEHGKCFLRSNNVC
ncbi:unnamed protein product [Ceutorhynchus assimilis]|uniref:Uncharacterized protein n=1 Tax=Ceutorhynchus assimilis TaxID=467358 RepID=A0A9N9MF16_9CUCU|nr:unnamed protein product [Ceutorhynchus assimilis]